MLGALAMDGGYIAEMKTGEGKTLSAVMPLYLNALMGRGAHLITVNDALAQRDKDEMAPVFKLLGLSVGCVLESHSPGQKRAGYQCDVTYTTDRAVGFDYLRDQLVSDPSQRVQREPYFALIDEVDEVLIDQARVPLVVATQQQPAGGDFALFTELVRELEPGQDYQVDRKESLAWLTDSGLELVECGLELRETERSLSEAISHFAEQSELAGKLRSKRDHLLRLRQAIRDEWALSAMDRAWSDHLEGMEELREGVRWETLIEKDPQQAYIQRGYQAFEELLADLRRQGVVPSAGAAS
jgi:preprotein translocase subunit SecA